MMTQSDIQVEEKVKVELKGWSRRFAVQVKISEVERARRARIEDEDAHQGHDTKDSVQTRPNDVRVLIGEEVVDHRVHVTLICLLLVAEAVEELVLNDEPRCREDVKIEAVQ